MTLHRRQMLGMLVAYCAAAGLDYRVALAAPDKNRQPEDNGKGCQLGEPVKQRWKVGAVIRATGGPCAGVFATVPVPTDWPEQEVQISDENVTAHVKDLKYRMLDNGVKQMLLSIPLIPANETATALLTFDVFRRPATPPKDTSILKRPEKLHSSLSPYLQSSPLIESKDEKIKALMKEILEGKSERSDWEKIEAYYTWIQDNIKYQNGPLKGALASLKDKTGDCEELTSLFIALCRASKVPARTVWVPQHCYPEFYLVDDEGQGHWIPCNIATNKHEFGELTDPRPVLQKGDNFRVPEQKDPQRYAAEFLKVKGLTGRPPQISWYREVLPGN